MEENQDSESSFEQNSIVQRQSDNESRALVHKEIDGLSIDLKQNWLDEFGRMAPELQTIASETENDFLELGGKLQNFALACMENAELATGVATQIESGSGFSISSFKSLFEEIYDVIETTTKTMSDGLNGIVDLKTYLYDIINMEEYLKKLARSITIIGTLIRIETAHAKQADFNIMTGIVDDLAKQIIVSTKEIVRTVDESVYKVTQVHDMIEPYIETFDKELSKVKERVRMVLDELDNMALQAKWLCERISGRASKITPEIGEVVTAIQFHDITRQQMEHVGEALDDILARFENFTESSNSEKVISMRWVYEVLKIQFGQLILVINETNKAANKITGHLSLVSDLSEAQAEDATLIIAEEESGSDKIKMIGIALDGLNKILAAIKTMGLNMSNSISEITDKISGMTDQVKNIELISENINLLSINAIIKASRTGADGRTLVVLAEEISKLSSTASEKIGEGFRTLTHILSKSEEFKHLLKDKLHEQLEHSEQISNKAKEGMEDLILDSKKMMDSMGSISEKTTILEKDITTVIQGINFHKLIEERLTMFHDRLEKIFNEIAEQIPPELMADPDLEPDLTEIMKRYTMQSERQVHETSAEQDGSDDIELFGDDDSKEDGLGDNIELF